MALPLGTLVNIGGSLLLLVSGVGIVALARGQAGVRVVGVVLALVGLDFVYGVLADGSVVLGWMDLALGVGMLPAALLAAWLYPSRATPRESRRLAVASVASVAWAVAALRANLLDAQRLPQLLAGHGRLAAGALLFAANPIQRAMERLTDGGERAPAARADAPQGSGTAEREDAYRHAVRLALRDRTLTREEERHLLRLAYHLGVPTPRAMQIHDMVRLRREAEAEARP